VRHVQSFNYVRGAKPSQPLVPGVQEKQSPIENTQNKAYQDLWSQLLLQHFEHPHPALL
jgi:hypothetical protein